MGLAPQPGVAQQAAPSNLYDHYRTYQAALEAGNLAQAEASGIAAWGLAQTALPDTDPNKGALAYNAAWVQVMGGKASQAGPAALAAVALARPGGPYSADEAKLLSAFASLAASSNRGDRDLIEAVSDAAQPLERLSVADTTLGLALGEASAQSMFAKRYSGAFRFADRAIGALQKSGDLETPLAVTAYLRRGLSNIGRDAQNRDVLEAYLDLRRALKAYGDPGDQPPPLWYLISTWHAAIYALAITDGISSRSLNRELDTPGGATPNQSETDRPRGKPECAQTLRRIEGNNIRYPSVDLQEYRVGAAILSAQLAADGSVTDVKVLGSIPNASFGNNAADAVRDWRYEVLASTPATCREDYEIRVIYTIE